MIVRIDFETRSRVDLRKVGAWIYSRHPSTEVLCMAYKIGDNETALWVPDYFARSGLNCPFDVDDETIIEAHNAFFEQCIWYGIGVWRFGWPEHRNWQCSAAKAAYHSLPRSLDGVASALNLREQKDKEGHRIMLQLSKPRKPTKNNPAHWFTDEAKYKKLYSYCLQDVETETAVSETLSLLPTREKRIWRMDQALNFRGVYADRAAIEGALDLEKVLLSETNRKLTGLTDGKITTIGQVGKLKKYLNELGCNLESLGRSNLEQIVSDSKRRAEECVDDLHVKNLPSEALKIINLRLSAARSSTKKYQAMLNRMDTDDRIRELVLYHGASTGRWTGLGIQIQNFPRGTIKTPDEIELAIDCIKSRDIGRLKLLFGDPMEALSSCLRAVLCAPMGSELIAADYSAIEARVLFWLADETAALRSLAAGKSLYIELAETIFSRPIDKYKNPQEYLLGKGGILGCGYQMWYPKFVATCANNGIDISDELGKRVVTTYRHKYFRVVNMWRDYEESAIKAVATKSAVKCGKVTFLADDDWMYIKLPSGRLLHYYKPIVGYDAQRKKPRLSYMSIEKGKWVRVYTYGGKLTENVDQATSRDLLAHAMLNLEANGLPLVLTVHDEAVAEVKKKDNRTVDEFCEIMLDKPSWADGLPLAAEGWKGKRFRK